MRNMLKDALKKRDFTEDAVIVAKAANIIREDVKEQRKGSRGKDQTPGGHENIMSAQLNPKNDQLGGDYVPMAY